MNDESRIEVADSLRFVTPKGKVVYGGGGIIPDIFVPVDANVQNETLNYIKSRGYVSYFVFEELDKDRLAFKGISKNDFIKNFAVSDDIVVRFQNYLSEKERVQITFVAYNDEVKQLIKAALAEQLFGKDAYEQIINSSDDMIEEVIKLSQGQ